MFHLKVDYVFINGKNLSHLWISKGRIDIYSIIIRQQKNTLKFKGIQ
jgi:hypothetical protein